jgi:LAO/AO transport system ATPase
VARLVTLVEEGDPCLPELAAALAPLTGKAEIIGLTGSPGVGKSTTTNELVRALREQGKRVGVLAVDPSSPFTGGAILGDRVRMQDHATDPGVYIRSMSTRGHLGGLAAATPQAVRVLRAPAATWCWWRPSAWARPRWRSPASPTPRWCCCAGHGRRDPGGQGRHPRDRGRAS